MQVNLRREEVKGEEAEIRKLAAIVNDRRESLNNSRLELDRNQTEVAAEGGRLESLRSSNAEEKRRLDADRLHLEEVRGRLAAEERELNDERARISEMWDLVGRHREQARQIISALGPETISVVMDDLAIVDDEDQPDLEIIEGDGA